MSSLTHFEFIWWWMFLLIPLPLIVYRFVPPVNKSAAVTLPYLPDSTTSGAPANHIARIVATLIWAILVIACARPVWYGNPVESQPVHRDMMLVVDLSGSMDMKDMEFDGEMTDRLSAVKRVLTEFIDKRKGDRLGLVLFADHAYLQTPLTLDRATISSQLNRAVLGLVGKKTAIGEGIGLATKTFVDSDAPQRVIVLLSDGENTAGVLDPVKAAEIAAKYNTRIYTVGIGAGEMVISEFFISRKVDTAKDLDEALLTEIAEMTGGRYFRARDQLELQAIYNTIDELEPVSGDSQTWRPRSEWFGYPLSLALLLSVLLTFLRRHHV